MTCLERYTKRDLRLKTPSKTVSLVDSCEDGSFTAREQKSSRLNSDKNSNFGIKCDTHNKCFELLGFDIMIEDNF